MLAACSTKTGTEFDSKIADEVMIGKTTNKEVHALLGTPSSFFMMRHGELWHHAFGRTGIRASSFIAYANSFHNEPDSSNTVLENTFDRLGKVVDCSVTSGTSVAWGGLSHMSDFRPPPRFGKVAVQAI